jgi:hypothetical protein
VDTETEGETSKKMDYKFGRKRSVVVVSSDDMAVAEVSMKKQESNLSPYSDGPDTQ